MAVLRWAGVVAVVVAAMALGRVVTDLSASTAAPVAPFVETGGVGDTVELEYADVTVTDVRSADALDSAGLGVRALGRFLLVDVEVTSTREATTFLGTWLEDSSGRRFVLDTRSTECPQNLTPLVGVPWRATYCFDVTRDALPGATLVFARSDYGVNGSGVRRDAVARIDLGISAAEAGELWETEETVTLDPAGPVGVTAE